MPYTSTQQAILREFGRRVWRARKARDWSQLELAEKADMSRSYVGAVERGERNLGLLNINKLALALGEPFDGFLPCSAGRRRQ